MTIFDALILGIIQGITEFLPISSSGHLILAETFLKLSVIQSKGFDVALHVGTLLAMICYFWKDYLELIKAFFNWIASLRHRKAVVVSHPSESQKIYQPMIGQLIIAMVPTLIIGGLFSDFLDEFFRNAHWVSFFLISVGVFFFVAEYLAKKIGAKPMTKAKALIIGVGQACALVPGVSRSGATIAAGLSTGIKREEAARFSFLLGSIAIAAAAVLSLYKLKKGEFTLPSLSILAVGVSSSFIVGLAAISFLMKFLKKHTLTVFAIYRIVFGIALLLFWRG